MSSRTNQLSFQKRVRQKVVLAGLALALGACTTQRLPGTFVLGAREQLQPLADNERRLAMLPRPGTDLSAWSAVWIDTVEMQVPELTAEEAELIRSTFREALAAELGKSRRVAAGPGPGVLRIRAVVTSAATSNVTMNVLLAAAIMVPLLNGGAAAEIAAEDSFTGERVAALAAADERRFSKQLDYFRRTGHARDVVSAFAREFADIVDPRWTRAGEIPPPRGAAPPASPRI